MTTILGLIGGSDRDEVVCRTALAAAVPFSAHLDFLHVHVSAGIAARYDAPAQFAMGAGIEKALDGLDSNAKNFSKVAAEHVRSFCASSKIEMREAARGGKKITANFREEEDTTIERLIAYARQSDLVVLGRAKQTQGLAPDTLEHLVKNCGRPVLAAASAAPQMLGGTVMVCWNGSENVARAVEAAGPILTHAKRVIFASVGERGGEGGDALVEVARRYARKGLAAEAQVIPMEGGDVPDLLVAAADNCGADLIVMGAFGRSRLRELVFGSCTEALLQDIDKPILLMH